MVRVVHTIVHSWPDGRDVPRVIHCGKKPQEKTAKAAVFFVFITNEYDLPHYG
jgi:hypothetical protein